MSTRNLSTTFTVDKSPEEAFAAITNVRAWWAGDIEGSSDELGDEFTYRYEDMHRSRQRVVEFVPGKKLVWLVLDSRLEFVDDKDEWTGSKITFELLKKGGQTEVRFTHVGLVPEHECYDKCSAAWGYYVGECLRGLIASSKRSA